MPYQIVFAWDKDCENELKKKGFEKTEVYMKTFCEGMNSKEMEKNG